MRNTALILIPLLFCAALLRAQDKHPPLDNNSAFYEGETMNYIVAPPDSFKMVSDDAVDDGYSFAFIPKGDDYKSASVIIGVNIFKVKAEQKKQFTINELIGNDTTAIREHFGKELSISEVDPIMTDDGHILRTIYLNDSLAFIPNVMMSYYDGGTEVFIFDLSISSTYPRFKAEHYYLDCVKRFRVMLKGDLGMKN